MTPAIGALLAKARESLAAAKVLFKDGYYDFAASRAYYSMFYLASALLVAKGQSYNSHSAVISAFGREYSKTGVMDPRFHRWLIDAQDLRNIGDYGIGSQVPKEHAEAICSWPSQFLSAASDTLRSVYSEDYLRGMGERVLRTGPNRK